MGPLKIQEALENLNTAWQDFIAGKEKFYKDSSGIHLPHRVKKCISEAWGSIEGLDHGPNKNEFNLDELIKFMEKHGDIIPYTWKSENKTVNRGEILKVEYCLGGFPITFGKDGIGEGEKCFSITLRNHADKILADYPNEELNVIYYKQKELIGE